MASRGFNMGLVAILVAMMWVTASAQSSSCTSAIINLSPCLNYITGNDSTPSGSCCSQLASVVQSEPQCLCTVLNGGASSLGLSINQTQALALPGACKVQTPPLSQCNANGGPTSSPTTPSTPSSGTPSVPSVPSGNGSKTIPTTDEGSSDGNSAKVPFFLIFFLSVATYASASFTSF